MNSLPAERTVAGCQWLCDGYVPCGLLAGHVGQHLPWRLIPGSYLPPPTLSPLYMLLLRTSWACPLCGMPLSYLSAEGVLTVRSEVADWGQVQPEVHVTFQPCGCVGREAPDGHDEAPAVEAGV